MLPSFSQTLTLKEAFETAPHLNEEVKLLLDRFFFAKHRKSVEKMTHRKKNRGHRTSKIVKYTQSYSNGHFPY